MPTLRLLTNVEIAADSRPELLARASRTVADLLGKPESYVMVILEGGRGLMQPSAQPTRRRVSEPSLTGDGQDALSFASCAGESSRHRAMSRTFFCTATAANRLRMKDIA
ncbi:hypothetical protein Alvin_0991 [Allochromatium vinosum DSM 180]|uniref:Uncharacterized protein n=1 Tax=Allochromatium vinosum (strain ATCC 17899 / DSM 180 / NBRC 103801 / NCIMB 10441 / D) TaxID=572477 RepID=D3RRN0_ALLVD|nr:hypothetical protein Alvin_0991 [Allochromatium vinosum DSM 180]